MKQDSAMKATDKRLKKLEKKLEKTYKSSAKSITKEWNEYMFSVDKEIKSLENLLFAARKNGDEKAAKELQSALAQEKMNQTIRSQYYKDMVEDTTNKLAHVNQTALAYVNDEMPWVYATNYNEAAKMADKVHTAFNIVDESTVRRLAMDGDVSLLRKRMDIPKDMAWNTRQLNSSVLQGILNGESMDKIAKRILPIVGNNSASAIRNARTMTTSAQNLGRIDSYHRLEEDGIVLRKVWMATHDERTRESHAEMDGEEVDIDERFSNGLMYPGDPDGEPEEVYNCRCTMVTHVVGFRKADGSIAEVDIGSYEPEYEFKQLEEVEGPYEANKSNVWDYIGQPIERPRAVDYGGYTDEFKEARELYKIQKEEQLERAEKWYEKNVNTSPMSFDELNEWCNKNNCSIYGSIDGLDGVALRNYTERFETLSKDFPEVQKYHEVIGRPFEIAYTPDRAYDAEATHGITFGNTYKDFHQTVLDNVSDSFMVRGANPAVKTFDHEFGHQVYFALRQNGVPFEESTIEDVHRRVAMEADLKISVFGKNGMSEYATGNSDELFAEGFAAWYGGEKTEFAKSFGEFLERWRK